MTGTFLIYRCPSCGYEVADIDYATIDDDDCPACGGVPVVEFTREEPPVVMAEKRKESRT